MVEEVSFIFLIPFPESLIEESDQVSLKRSSGHYPLYPPSALGPQRTLGEYVPFVAHSFKAPLIERSGSLSEEVLISLSPSSSTHGENG